MKRLKRTEALFVRLTKENKEYVRKITTPDFSQSDFINKLIEKLREKDKK